MMARANRQKTVEQRQKRLEKNAAPVVLSAKARRQANRARRAHYREKFACSGHRLIKLQEEDDTSFYIGFVGTNRAGRAQALKSVEAFLKKSTEMKARGWRRESDNSCSDHVISVQVMSRLYTPLNGCQG